MQASPELANGAGLQCALLAAPPRRVYNGLFYGLYGLVADTHI